MYSLCVKFPVLFLKTFLIIDFMAVFLYNELYLCATIESLGVENFEIYERQ